MYIPLSVSGVNEKNDCQSVKKKNSRNREHRKINSKDVGFNLVKVNYLILFQFFA